MDWFLYDIGLRHERVKHSVLSSTFQKMSNLAICHFSVALDIIVNSNKKAFEN